MSLQLDTVNDANQYSSINDSEQVNAAIKSEKYSAKTKKFITLIIFILLIVTSIFITIKILNIQKYKACVKGKYNTIRNDIKPAICINKNGKVFYKNGNIINKPFKDVTIPTLGV